MFFPLIWALPWTGHSVTIIHYLLHPQKIYSFDWGGLLDCFSTLIVPFLIDVYLLFYMIKPQKGGITLKEIIKKGLVIALMIFIPYAVLLIVTFIEAFSLI